MNEWSLLFTLLGSIIALTVLVSIMIRHRFKGRSIIIAAAHILGIFAGIGGASQGPGEITTWKFEKSRQHPNASSY